MCFTMHIIHTHISSAIYYKAWEQQFELVLFSATKIMQTSLILNICSLDYFCRCLKLLHSLVLPRTNKKFLIPRYIFVSRFWLKYITNSWPCFLIWSYIYMLFWHSHRSWIHRSIYVYKLTSSKSTSVWLIQLTVLFLQKVNIHII